MAPRRLGRSTNPNTAVAYIRVSTSEQTNGQDAQRQAIQQWAEANKVKVVAWHIEAGVSGGAELDRRPELMAALDALSVRRAGLLVVAKRDHLARDVVNAGMIERLVQRREHASSRPTAPQRRTHPRER